MKKNLARTLPLILIISIICIALHYRLAHYLSFEAIKTHKTLLLNWIHGHYIASVCSFILFYIIIVSLSIPGPVFLTLTSGFLFGYLWGAIYDVIGATIGATVIFLIVQFSIGQWLAEKNARWVKRMQSGFQENALQYLLFLRLVPLFPFPVINVVSGILNIRTSTYIIGTFFGIMPGSFVYAWLGHGLGYAFSTGKAPNLSVIFQPSIFWPIIGLAALSLCPIIAKRIKKQMQSKNNHTA